MESVSALLTTAVFPFLRAKAPQAISYAALKRHSTTSRSLPSPTSEHSHCDTAPRPEVHRQGSSSPTFTSATLSPVEQNASESSSIPSSSSPRATIPFPIERRVTFDLETSKTEEERHIITGPVHGDTISINPPLASQPETSNQATEGSPTALGSAQDKDGCKRLDFLGELCHHAPRRDSNASTSRSLVGRLLKRQNTASETGHCTETEADTVATPASTLASLPAGSRPSTPCPMSSSDDGHAEIGVPSTDSKNRRKMPLKLQLRAFKRRSVPGVPVTETPDALRDPSTSSSTPPTAISTESSSTAVKAGSGPDQTSGPPSATSATDKTRQKESPAAKKPKAFPFQHSAPSTRPMSPKKPLRTNPYGAPYFAPVPVPRERRSSRRISDDDDDDVEHVSPEDPPRRQERPRSMQASLSTPGGVVGLDLDLGLGSASSPSALSSQDGRRASARASLPPISGSSATTTAQPAKVKQRVVSAPVPARPRSAIPSSSSKPPVAGPRKSSAVNEFDLVSPSDLNAPGSHSDTEAMAPSAFKRRRSVFAKFRLGKPSHTGTDTESRSQPTSRTKAKA
ncbi:hypothetical protein FRB99_007183 [Tulasnella sp. 403]|nr:hypothetical protein FRB99_007183 [Tulasnella sp. 403]